MLKHLTAGRVAAFGLILFIVGNELSEPALRQVLEILAGVLAAAGSCSSELSNPTTVTQPWAAGTTLHVPLPPLPEGGPHRRIGQKRPFKR